MLSVLSDIKLTRLDNNRRAVKYEKSMNLKMAVLTMMLMMRHKSGESTDDLLEFARKTEADQESKKGFKSAFDSILVYSPKALEFMLSNEPAFVKSTFETLLEQTRGVPMASDNDDNEKKTDLANDMKLKQLRELLIFVARNSGDKDVKTLAVRLILRLGYIFGTAQDLLMAADLQKELRLDISWELMPLLGSSEKLKIYHKPVHIDQYFAYRQNDQ